jgi:hypothetical protein
MGEDIEDPEHEEPGPVAPKTWVAREQSRTARKEVAFGPNRATPAGEWRVEGTAPRRAACPAFVL